MFQNQCIIIGGGVIALEMGQMFQRFGCRTTILERSEYPLAEFDQRLTAQLCSSMANEGLQQLFGVELQYVEKTADGDARIVALIKGREPTLQAERIMLAVGTEPATKGVGLNVVGVALDDNGFIRTDEYARTTTEGIWAAGDVTGPPLIAPAGELEAEVAVENMFSKKQLKIDHSGTPMAVFVDPEISMVGQDGQAASASGYDVVETYLELSAVAKSYVLGQSTGAFLLWSDRNSGLILGAQVLAPRAADLIHEMAVAVKHKLTVSDIASLVHVYPTISDGWRLLARKCLSALAKVPV